MLADLDRIWPLSTLSQVNARLRQDSVNPQNLEAIQFRINSLEQTIVSLIEQTKLQNHLH